MPGAKMASCREDRRPGLRERRPPTGAGQEVRTAKGGEPYRSWVLAAPSESLRRWKELSAAVKQPAAKAKPGREAMGVADTPASASGRGPDIPLPPLIHGRVRLLILCRLMGRPGGAAFTELKQVLDLTDGTLSVHLGKLAAGGLVAIRKEFVGKKPQTLIRMTAAGRRQFARYVQELRDLVPGLAAPEV